MSQDADRRGDRAHLPDGPVSQDTDHLFLAQELSPHFFVHQRGGDVVLGLCSSLKATFKQAIDEALELARDFRQGLAVLSPCGLVFSLGPEHPCFLWVQSTMGA